MTQLHLVAGFDILRRHVTSRLALLMLALLGAPGATAAATDVKTHRWEGLLGAGVMIEPRFQGSGESTTLPAPIVDLRRGRLMVQSTRGLPVVGLSFLDSGGLSVSGIVGFERGRSKSDLESESLSAQLKVSPHPSVGLETRATTRLGPLPVEGLIRGRARLGAGDGALFDARVTSGLFETERAAAELFVQAAWASGSAQAQDFPQDIGIGDRPSGSDFRESRFGVSVLYRLRERQGIALQLERRSLHGEARQSSVTSKDAANALVVGYYWWLP